MNFKRISLILLILSLITLIAITVLNPKPLLHDEVLFPKNVLLMEKYGLSVKFFKEMKDQAPGPLYQFVHLPLKTFTHLKPPGIRVVNLLFLCSTIFCFFIIFKKQYQGRSTPLGLALNVIIFPMIWQVAGLALTEMPAIFFASLFLLFFAKLKSSSSSANQQVFLAILGGISLSLAILGRTPYLVVLGAVGIWFLTDQNLSLKHKLGLSLIISILSVLFIIPIFIIWEGLVPPQQASAGVDEGIKWWHGILGCSYGAIVALIVCPKWFRINWKIAGFLTLFFLLFLFVADSFENSDYVPLSTSAKLYMPEFLFLSYQSTFPAVMATLGIYFLISGMYNLYDRREDPLFILAFSAMVLLLLSNIKISHLFSSRYIAQAVPFMLIVFAPYEDFNTWHKSVRILIGVIIGLLSLNTYAQLF